MSNQINTVGDLRKLLEHSEDNEPLECISEEFTWLGTKKMYLLCKRATSTAGGRGTILWFQAKEP